ncbi:MAG: hypothetical protein AB7E60_13995 [Sphingobium sp.]
MSARSIRTANQAERVADYLDGIGEPKRAEDVRALIRSHLATRTTLQQVHGDNLALRSTPPESAPSIITDQQRIDLQWLWLSGWPVKPAADHLGMPAGKAYQIVQKLKLQLVAEGKPFPRALPKNRRPLPGQPKPAKTAPTPRQTKPNPKPAVATTAPATPPPAHPAQMAPAPERAPPQPPASPPPRAAQPRQRISFEEQLARVAAGKAGLIPNFKPTRPTIDATLGGVGSAML